MVEHRKQKHNVQRNITQAPLNPGKRDASLEELLQMNSDVAMDSLSLDMGSRIARTIFTTCIQLSCYDGSVSNKAKQATRNEMIPFP